MSAQQFREAARDQRVCAVTGQGGRAYHAHHAIKAQDVRALGGDEWDRRNALRVLWQVHLRHHAYVEPIPLTALTDENIEFAFELLGDHAAEYLRRHYAGEDRRVTDRLQSEAS